MLFRIPEYLIPSGGSYDIFGESGDKARPKTMS